MTDLGIRVSIYQCASSAGKIVFCLFVALLSITAVMAERWQNCELHQTSLKVIGFHAKKPHMVVRREVSGSMHDNLEEIRIEILDLYSVRAVKAFTVLNVGKDLPTPENYNKFVELPLPRKAQKIRKSRWTEIESRLKRSGYKIHPKYGSIFESPIKTEKTFLLPKGTPLKKLEIKRKIDPKSGEQFYQLWYERGNRTNLSKKELLREQASIYSHVVTAAYVDPKNKFLILRYGGKKENNCDSHYFSSVRLASLLEEKANK